MRVLLIVHGLPPDTCGGTETYTAGLAGALASRPGISVSILAREADAARPELHVRRERRGRVDVWFINNTFQRCTSFEETYRHPALCAAALTIVDQASPDVVHVQHLTGLSTDLVKALDERGLPILMTLNDYWPICHRGQLLDLHGRRCDGPGDDGCDACIHPGVLAPPAAWHAVRRLRELPIPVIRSLPRVADAVMPHRRGATRNVSAARARHMRDMLQRPAVLLAPSPTLREQYMKFGVPPERLVLCEQAAMVAEAAPRQRRDRAPHEPLNVVFAGSLIQSKGPHVLLDALMHLPDGAVTVDFLGAVAPYHGDTRYSAALLSRLGHPAVRRLGAVPHERVGAVLSDADVAVVSSTWIENAPFVIREAFAHGVPVLASRLGGMADMVRDGIDGLLFEPGDGRSLAEALGRLIDDPELLTRLRTGIRPPLSPQGEAAHLEALYRRSLSRKPRDAAAEAPPLSESRPRVAAVILNYGTPDETYLAARSVQTSHVAADVIVVDNGSGDDAALRSMMPGATVIATRANLGFSGGCNAGIAAALDGGAEFVLLLNSDAVLHPDCLDRLVAVLQSDQHVGMAAPIVYSLDEPGIIGTAGMKYDPATGRMRHRAAGRRVSAIEPGVATRVDGASGCALLVRRSVFERCGLLDDAYFFTFEDLEFCLRARAAGFATVCVPDAAAYHKGGKTIGHRSSARVYYGVRNHLRMANRVAPAPPIARAARSAAIVLYNLAYVGLSPDVRLVPGLAALVRGAFDHARGRYGPLVAPASHFRVE